MAPLPPKRRSALRAQAHKLNPIVLIGDKGLTDEVVAEIDRCLAAHELIKVRAASGERQEREAWLGTICERLQAHPVQLIGKVLVIYREKPDPAPPPARAGGRGDEERRRPRGEVVGSRGKRAQRSRDAEKQRLRDIADMKRKGKIPAGARLGPGPSPAGAGGRGDERKADGRGEARRTSRPRSRTPSPLPESGLRRRRPRTSR